MNSLDQREVQDLQEWPDSSRSGVEISAEGGFESVVLTSSRVMHLDRGLRYSSQLMY